MDNPILCGKIITTFFYAVSLAGFVCGVLALIDGPIYIGFVNLFFGFTNFYLAFKFHKMTKWFIENE